MLTIAGGKMSKSLGNFITVRSLMQKYAPEVLRMYLLSIARGPVTGRRRLACYALLGPWIVKHFRRMMKDLLIAADLLLYRVQTYGMKAPQAAAAAAPIETSGNAN